MKLEIALNFFNIHKGKI